MGGTGPRPWAIRHGAWLSTLLDQPGRRRARSAPRSRGRFAEGVATLAGAARSLPAGVPVPPAPVRRGHAGVVQESLAHPGLALHGLVSEAGGVVIFTDRVVIARVAEVLVLVELG
jgi:hypothetical protein